jgi:ADP-ribose pyrophosphatase YjhB (NUDIX family)
MYKVFNDNVPLIIHSDIFYLAEVDNFLYIKYEKSDEWRYIFENLWLNEGIKGLSVFSDNSTNAWSEFKSNFKFVSAAGGIVHNEHDEILVIERNKHLDLPKGHIEDEELAKDAALREVAEECGLKNHTLNSSNPKVSYHIYRLGEQWVLKKTYWFKMIASRDEQLTPQKEEGISDIYWLDKKTITNRKSEFYSSLLDLLV